MPNLLRLCAPAGKAGGADGEDPGSPQGSASSGQSNGARGGRSKKPQIQAKKPYTGPTARSAAVLLRMLQSGAFINHMWGDANTVLGNMQMFFVRLLMIWPVKAVAPAAYAYWAYRIGRRWRGIRTPKAPWPQSGLPFLRAALAWAGREALRVWFASEVFFSLHYHFKHWQLSRRGADAPVLPPGEPTKNLEKALEATAMIQSGGRLAEPPHLALSKAFMRRSQSLGVVKPNPSAHDLQGLLLPRRGESGVEQVLRDWHDASLAEPETDLCVPVAVTDTERASIVQLVDEAEVLALKRAEACGWFVKASSRNERWPTSRFFELLRGNVTEWSAWAFFNSEPEEVASNRQGELKQLVDQIAVWAEVELKPGYNPEAVALRLTMDPIPSAHRPFLVYIFTQTLFNQVIHLSLNGLGFRQHFSGTLGYWRRDGDAPPGDAGAVPKVPIVFCHGIGVNLLPYRPIIDEMLRRMPDRTFFLISLPHISMRLKEDVPSRSEVVACISDMLTNWGFASANFVGHSFGSIPMAWMARKAPEFVSSMTFIDPVCFLLVKPDVCYNFVYREPSDPTQLMLSYFVSKELYIAHTLSRNFFWYQNQLWPEDLPGPTLVVLGGRDSVVPAHSVRRYLMAYKQRKNMDSLRVLWFPALGHGEMNFGPVGEAACTRIVTEILKLDADFPR